MEKEYIKLADGCEVRRGPWINEGGFMVFLGEFEVGVFAINPKELQFYENLGWPLERWGDSLGVLEVKFPTNYGCTIRLPEVKILNKELWTKELATEVIRVLRQSDKDKKLIGYVIAKLSKEEKDLALGDGRRLIGGLGFSMESDREVIGHYDLQVLGNIESSKSGKSEKIILLTIKHLYPYDWPGSSIGPTYVKNKDVWCKKLEFVVINYLNMLIDFVPRGPLDKQILRIANDLKDKTEWLITCRKFFQQLVNLNPDAREDSKILQAFALIDEVSQA